MTDDVRKRAVELAVTCRAYRENYDNYANHPCSSDAAESIRIAT